MVGALLLSLVAAAFPLFISRSEGDLLRAQMADPTIGRNGAGLFYSMTNVGFTEEAEGGGELLTDRLDEEFGRIAQGGPNLGPALRFVLGAGALVTLPGQGDPESGPVSGRIFSGTNGERFVEVIEGDGSEGALVPDSVADPLGVGPGDLIQLSGRTVIRVGGVYRALYKSPRSGYWSPWSEQILSSVPPLPGAAAVHPRRAGGSRPPDARTPRPGGTGPRLRLGRTDRGPVAQRGRGARRPSLRGEGTREGDGSEDSAGSPLRVLRSRLRGRQRLLLRTTGHGVPVVDAVGAP